MFYSLQEAAEKLNLTAEQLKELAQEGVIYKKGDGYFVKVKVEVNGEEQ